MALSFRCKMPCWSISGATNRCVPVSLMPKCWAKGAMKTINPFFAPRTGNASASRGRRLERDLVPFAVEIEIHACRPAQQTMSILIEVNFSSRLQRNVNPFAERRRRPAAKSFKFSG